jgi:phosphoglycerate dehydrogenase-like enzyme
MNITIFITHPDIPCWNFSEENRKRLQKALPDAEIHVCSSKEEFQKKLMQTEIVLIWNMKQEWLEKAFKLKWIVTPAAGRDYFRITPPEGVDIDYCSFHGELIGETVIAMMLAEVRGIRATLEFSKGDPWPRKRIGRHMRPLRGSHLVVLGFGHIGGWIARLAKPFGVKITGVKRTPALPPRWFEAGDSIISIDSLDSVLPYTDHLALALPGGDETTDLIDKKRINLLPPHAVIYNIGRGNAIDEQALFDALQSNRLQAAYLDVVKTEPLPSDSLLRHCHNCIIMPHASAIAPNYLDLFIDEFVEKYKKKFCSKK